MKCAPDFFTAQVPKVNRIVYIAPLEYFWYGCSVPSRLLCPGQLPLPLCPTCHRMGPRTPRKQQNSSHVTSRHARVVLSITDLGVGPNNITRHHPLAICHRVQTDVDGSSWGIGVWQLASSLSSSDHWQGCRGYWDPHGDSHGYGYGDDLLSPQSHGDF